MQFHGQLWAICILRLEGTCRATFSQLPQTRSPEPCGVWVAKGERVLAWAREPQPKTALNGRCFPCGPVLLP